MKKLYFSFMLMACGSIILAGGLIGAGTAVSGSNVNNFYYGIVDAPGAMIFIVGGTILFLFGLLLSIRYTFLQEVA